VLVVDDNDDSLLITSLVLEEYEVQLVTATSAKEALVSLTQFKPDILISDIAMPEIDGYELIRQIRSLPPSEGGLIPALALTAYTRDEERILALNAGFQMHVTKPVEPAELVAVVTKLVGCFLIKEDASTVDAPSWL
jgi:CheY-like chemotaxis protein